MLRRLLSLMPLPFLASCGSNPGNHETHSPDWEALRARMVEQQIERRGVRSPQVLAAMHRVPRHEFVPSSLRHEAYHDYPLPIGFGQTISQPYIVAAMTEALALRPSDKVLEIGTGSGYQAAVLAELVSNVYSIEIIPELAQRAAADLFRLGYTNVHVRTGDGYAGWPEHAPFDAIIVTCAPENIPPPLVQQLADGGRMVIPVGGRWGQSLVRMTKRAGALAAYHAALAIAPDSWYPRRRRFWAWLCGGRRDFRRWSTTFGRRKLHRAAARRHDVPASCHAAARYTTACMAAVQQAAEKPARPHRLGCDKHDHNHGYTSHS